MLTLTRVIAILLTLGAVMDMAPGRASDQRALPVTVSWCESTHNPFAQNGRYKGLFQLGWSPFGFSPFDPVANALSAAMTVRHDGSWRQWQCSP